MAGGLGALGQDAAREAAVSVGQLDKARQHAGDAERAGVASVDAREQRLGEVVHGLAAVVFHDEIGYRFVVRFGLGGAQ